MTFKETNHGFLDPTCADCSSYDIQQKCILGNLAFSNFNDVRIQSPQARQEDHQHQMASGNLK